MIRSGGASAMRLAVVCAVVPMASGIFVFLGWLFTRWSGWELAGIGVAHFGLFCFAVGLWARAKALQGIESLPPPLRRSHRIASLGVAALLLLNFPLAGTLIYLHTETASRWTLVVHNDGAAPLEDVLMRDRISKWEIGTIASGESTRVTLRKRHDESPVLLDLTVGGVRREQELDVYFHHYGGDRLDVRVDRAGDVTVLR